MINTEQSNSQRQKAEQCLPRVKRRENRDVIFKGCRVSVGGD
jgi:hypothetical protein